MKKTLPANQVDSPSQCSDFLEVNETSTSQSSAYILIVMIQTLKFIPAREYLIRTPFFLQAFIFHGCNFKCSWYRRRLISFGSSPLSHISLFIISIRNKHQDRTYALENAIRYLSSPVLFSCERYCKSSSRRFVRPLPLSQHSPRPLPCSQLPKL
jgi:hypothetical protein